MTPFQHGAQIEASWVRIPVPRKRVKSSTVDNPWKVKRTPASFLFIFGVLQTNNSIFTTNQCKKCPSSIWHSGLNPQPFKHKSSPITTRPGLPPPKRTLFYWRELCQFFILCTLKRVRLLIRS